LLAEISESHLLLSIYINNLLLMIHHSIVIHFFIMVFFIHLIHLILIHLIHLVHLFIIFFITFHFFTGEFFFILILSVILFFDDFHILLLLLLLHIRIDTLYQTIRIILHALCWLNIWHLITCYFLLQTLWTESLMTRSTKWSNLLPSNFWWLHLSELIISKITLRCFWG